jgi:hypothetical protein
MLGKLVIIIVACLALAAGWLVYLGQGLQNASIERFELDSVRTVGQNGITLSGTVWINNPSKLTLPIGAIMYDIVLEDTGAVISSGTIPAFEIAPQQVTKMTFTHELQWTPSSELAAQLASQEHVYAQIKGSAQVILPAGKQLSIPLQTRFDLKPYLERVRSSDAVVKSIHQ